MAFINERGDSCDIVRDHFFSSDPISPHDGCIDIAFMTLSFAKHFMLSPQSYGFPGMFFDHDNCTMSSLMSKNNERAPIMSQHGVFLPLTLLPHVSRVILDTIASHSMEKGVFVRPDSGNKLFTGDFFALDGFHENIKSSLGGELKHSGSSLCLLAPAHKADPVEWRFWIVADTIATYAPYGWEGIDSKQALPDSIMSLARRVVSMLDMPHGTYVLDIGSVLGDPRVIEVNAMSTSGWYPGMNVGNLLDAIKNLAINLDCDDND